MKKIVSLIIMMLVLLFSTACGMFRYSSSNQDQVGRGLMSNPQIILLDEPSMGLAPIIVNEILAILQVIKEELGTKVILVEQNVKAALKVADRAYVLDQGRVILSGTGEELSNNPHVMSAYLGLKSS